MNRAVKTAAGIAGGLALAHAAPALTSIQPLEPLRTKFFPGYGGLGDPGHVALSFDDGPDPISTPRFLRLLEKRDVKATFFLLGFMLERDPGLGKEIIAAGHEIAVHGYLHRPMVVRTPRATKDDLTRAHGLVTEATGVEPRWYRPPYGIATTSALTTARGLGMTPVLWTSWGADWRAGATGTSVYQTVTRNLRGGGTILLHDSDCTSAPASWTATLAALPRLLDHCAEQGWQVGPVGEHGI
ncbi:polysaccharide deacetylase family protein [Streptacidiphilus fuscans]|uniref:Polysaccharide deacetylase family protein n=1 Tax=Streptacidiphilus fuscans TaxID=2789292 RepID=A0A931B4K6_9ACTN|nr:polysaccharide deacetylase family protein [Streptacidiphilus fuscans]MBF9070183.1 polysaccharide deacetylase family protein [Streptacidiphilus fuscans]